MLHWRRHDPWSFQFASPSGRVSTRALVCIPLNSVSTGPWLSKCPLCVAVWVCPSQPLLLCPQTSSALASNYIVSLVTPALLSCLPILWQILGQSYELISQKKITTLLWNRCCSTPSDLSFITCSIRKHIADLWYRTGYHTLPLCK